LKGGVNSVGKIERKSKSNFKVIAIDTGITHVGLSYFNDNLIYDCYHLEIPSLERKNARIVDNMLYKCNLLSDELKMAVQTHQPNIVIGELPNGSSKSAKALRSMVASMIFFPTFFNMAGVKNQWCTPMDVKKAATGCPNADKNMVMDAIRERYSYFVFPKFKKDFEHIADSCGVFLHFYGGANA